MVFQLGGRTNLAFHFASAFACFGPHLSTYQTVIQVFSLKLNLASFCYNCFWPLISFLATGCFLGTTSNLGLQGFVGKSWTIAWKQTQAFKNDGWKIYFPSRIVPCQLSLVHFQGVYPFISAKFKRWGSRFGDMNPGQTWFAQISPLDSLGSACWQWHRVWVTLEVLANR